jgi:hypothetical protein
MTAEPVPERARAAGVVGADHQQHARRARQSQLRRSSEAERCRVEADDCARDRHPPQTRLQPVDRRRRRAAGPPSAPRQPRVGGRVRSPAPRRARACATAQPRMALTALVVAAAGGRSWVGCQRPPTVRRPIVPTIVGRRRIVIVARPFPGAARSEMRRTPFCTSRSSSRPGSTRDKSGTRPRLEARRGRVRVRPVSAG